ncbi:MAG TPA: GNAT family N-acetyltransferase [bacterium]
MPDQPGKVKPTIRRATISDLKAITDIYNESVVLSVATFDTEPKTMDDQVVWFKSHGPKHPILVAEIGPDVVGWCSLSPWSDRCAYSDSVELSIYINAGHQGKGIGTELVRAVLLEATKHHLHSVVARIETSNSVIIHVLEKFYFQKVGVLKEIGKKFNRRLDVLIMQLIITG